MRRVITKELAIKIVKKLDGQIARGKGAHDEYDVYHDGQYVVTLSIRRGSNREQGHDFMQRDLHCNTSFAKQLAQCTASREDWVAMMIQKGYITAPPDAAQN